MKKTTAIALFVLLFVGLFLVPVFALDPITEAVGKEFKGKWIAPGGGFWNASVKVNNIVSLDGKKSIEFTYRQQTAEGEVTKEDRTEIIDGTGEKLLQFKFSGDKENVVFRGTFMPDGRLRMELTVDKRYFVQYFVQKP